MREPDIILVEPLSYDPNCDVDSFWDQQEKARLVLPNCFHLRSDNVAKRSRKKDRACCDGSRRFGNEWQERKVEVMGPLEGDQLDKESLMELGCEVREFVSRPGIKMLWCGKYLNLSRLDRIQWPWTMGFCYEVADVRISWFAGDPYWYDLDSQTLALTGTAGADGANLGSVDSGCKFETFPKLTLSYTGAAVDDAQVTITNDENGKTFILNLPGVSPGEDVCINNETGEVLLTGPTGAPLPDDQKTNLIGSFLGEYFSIDKDVPNSLTYTSNIDFNLTIDWRCRYI